MQKKSNDWDPNRKEIGGSRFITLAIVTTAYQVWLASQISQPGLYGMVYLGLPGIFRSRTKIFIL